MVFLSGCSLNLVYELLSSRTVLNHQIKSSSTNLWECRDVESIHVSTGQLCAVRMWRRRGGMWWRGMPWRRHRRLPHIRPAIPLLGRLVSLPQLPDAGVLGRLRRVRGRHDLGFGFRHPTFHIPVWVWGSGSVGRDGRRGRSVRLPSPAYHGVEGIVSTCGGGALAHFWVSVLPVLSGPRGDLRKLPALRTEVRVRPAAEQQQKVHAGWTFLFRWLCKADTGHILDAHHKTEFTHIYSSCTGHFNRHSWTWINLLLVRINLELTVNRELTSTFEKMRPNWLDSTAVEAGQVWNRTYALYFFKPSQATVTAPTNAAPCWLSLMELQDLSWLSDIFERERARCMFLNQDRTVQWNKAELMWILF